MTPKGSRIVAVWTWSGRSQNRNCWNTRENSLRVARARLLRWNKAANRLVLGMHKAPACERRFRYGPRLALIVLNEGPATGRNVKVELDGGSLLAHTLVPRGQDEVTKLGPGAQARYLLAPTMGSLCMANSKFREHSCPCRDLGSQNGTTGSDSQLVGYAASWRNSQTQSHMRRSRS